MWFFDQRYGIYWLTSTDERHNVAPPDVIPDEAPFREVSELAGDWVWDTYAARDRNRNRKNYFWFCNDNWMEPGKGEVAKVEFPKTVTLQNLAEFHSKAGKKESIRLDEQTTLVKGGHFYYLNCAGNRLLAWGIDETGKVPSRIYFYAQNQMNQHQVEALTKYLGTEWSLVGKDGMAGFQNKEGVWTMATQYAMFQMDGNVDEREKYVENFQKPNLETYLKIVANVRRYTQEITPEKVKKVTAGITNTSHSIFTRCDGCQSLNAMHLTAHMVRNDLDPFLIYAAYDSFGDEVYGGALRQTWDLVTDPNQLAVMKFKGIMESFLLDSLRQQIKNVCWLPSGKRGNSNRWPLFGNNAPMIVDGGVRLVQGRREEHNDGMSDGEYLAAVRRQELAGQPRQPRRPRVVPEIRENAVARLLRWERPGGVAIAPEPFVEPAVEPEENLPRWEPEPFDVELDLDNPEAAPEFDREFIR